MVKQFDIYLVNFDPAFGSEIKKSRPAVVVSPDAMNKTMRTVIVAPLTSRIKSYPFRVRSVLNKTEGEIALEQLRAIDKRRLAVKLGKLDSVIAANTKLVLQTMFS
ncbi:MAG TPA: type II toxin-antitoxin system PemK/MazF family toxin [Chitinophagaceae bacterium]|nr:type II toxin-antitoxin system PemK/MazF family toxin [Chitinophagaceae bacterium]